MKITQIEDLHCDAGWRTFSFLKVSTDAGIIGYSEYNESYGSKGLNAVIRALGEGLVGADPRPIERLTARLHALTRSAPGGLNQQAIAAIENALLDVKAKSLGVPVYELLGGPVRDRLRLYWSHCGTYRLHHHALLRTQPVRSRGDLVALGREVADRGFTALKTNIFLFDGDAPSVYQPGFAAAPGGPELNWERRLNTAIVDQIAALREGAGAGVDIALDLNFNFKTEGFAQVARAVEGLGLMWLELDIHDAAALAFIRRSAGTPIASLETIYGRRGYRPYFEHGSADVAIVGRAVERHHGIDEDRGHGRCLRSQRRAPQLLRPPVEPDERPLLGGAAQLPHHGDRHRRRALEGRPGDEAPGHRGRPPGAAHGPRLGRRRQRGGGAGAPAEVGVGPGPPARLRPSHSVSPEKRSARKSTKARTLGGR